MTEGPIEPPSPHPKRALARGVAEGAVEIIPGASLLTKIYAVTHPPIEELERQRWEVDMSRRSNEQDELLKRLVGAHLRVRANHQRANDAQQLSFIRGGMVSSLEAIAREGLSADTESELRRKFEATTSDVEELLKGLDAALGSMSDDERNREFVDILHETVFGSFGKSSIRKDISGLLHAGRKSIEWQRNAAAELCERIDRFNANLARLSNYAMESGDL
ncbi:hypothetical protein [Rhizobium leguminosarum]|uniref:hypothetical protein n=1 Tax=Rhizobium TaxID=379 RepID=UPI001441AF39|nr:hypothetical protein [Rhizobium leguminosarum]MBY5798295.1 hypothetical protein [Rhizobium leguminosarum]MDH6270191.1 hypothetical protein [Rhizobium leguminosarum]NKL96303.1 hypothetical protein [Rhizobium leguminosarum bv. viciae]